MRPRLFLTGEVGCGKSTAIASAVGEHISDFGGFITRRNLNPQGKTESFSLVTTDGSQEETFLKLIPGAPSINLDVFEKIGISALEGKILLLDEIGGVELLNPMFYDALVSALQKDVPILGVLKGNNGSKAMVAALGLSSDCLAQINKLWDILEQDENTMIYHCEQYDEKAVLLAEEWVREYFLCT